MKRYIIIIENALRNFSAFCPDVPGCVTTGNTVENTAGNMRKAMESHLEDEAILPEAHDITYLQNHGFFTEIAEEFFISSVEVNF